MDDKATTKLLFRAIMRGQLKSVKILVDGGADVNAKDKDGQSSLMKALEEINPAARDMTSPRHKIVLYLIEKGADPSITDNTGRNVFHLPQISQFPVLNDLLAMNKNECSCNIQLTRVSPKQGIQRFVTTCEFCKPYAGSPTSNYNSLVSAKDNKNYRDRSNTDSLALAKAEEINQEELITQRNRSNTDGTAVTLNDNSTGHCFHRMTSDLNKESCVDDHINKSKSVGLGDIEIVLV